MFHNGHGGLLRGRLPRSNDSMNASADLVPFNVLVNPSSIRKVLVGGLRAGFRRRA